MNAANPTLLLFDSVLGVTDVASCVGRSILRDLGKQRCASVRLLPFFTHRATFFIQSRMNAFTYSNIYRADPHPRISPQGLLFTNEWRQQVQIVGLNLPVISLVTIGEV